jgi:hypothetical protein
MLLLVTVAVVATAANGLTNHRDADLVTSSLETHSIALLQDNSMGPVEKVANLLQDMSKTLEKDAENDEDLNVEMGCWCKSNREQKTKSIADNTQKSGDLTAEIKSLREKSQLLTTELDHLNGEVANNKKELETAIAMRKTEFKEFVSAEKSTAGAISALKGATNALSKMLPKSTLQTDMTLDVKSGVVQALAHSLDGHHSILWAIHNEKERKILAELMAHTRDVGFIQGGSKTLTINAPYMVIHGTIQSLHDAFSANLAKMQQDEEDATAHHEALKKTKKEQILAGIGSIDEKTQTLASTDERAAAARQELADTNDVLEGDTTFLNQVVEQCDMHDKEYAERKQTRQEELGALSKAIAILTNEEARDTFTRTFGHTKRPEEGKLGSRLLKEHKEERESESLRSQTSAARKKMWGTSERYFFLQTSSEAQTSSPNHTKAEVATKESAQKPPSSLAGMKKLVRLAGTSSEAAKLATIADRTQQFWAAKYYNEAQDTKKIQSAAKARSASPNKSKVQAQHKVGLSANQVRLRGNAMAQVGQGVTKMKENLEIQQGMEAARKNWCVDEIHRTERELDNTNRKKLDQEESIQLTKERIARLEAEIKQIMYEQEDADIELAKASIDRKEAGTEFQKTVLDQDASKKLLGMALKVLGAFYKKKQASLIRQKVRVDKNSLKAIRVLAGTLYGPSDPLSFDAARKQEAAQSSGSTSMDLIQQAPPPPGFQPYSPNAAKGGLLTMIDGLIEDADAMTKEAVKDETRSMENYEGYVKGANTMTRKRHAAILNRQLEVGKLESFKLDEMIRLNETIKTKAHLRQTNIDLYGVEGCDYLIKNYAVRYVERQEEINQLSQAQAVLGAHGGDAEQTAMSHAEGDTLAEKAAKDMSAGDSAFTPVDDGVLVEGPEGEEAVAHMS